MAVGISAGAVFFQQISAEFIPLIKETMSNIAQDSNGQIRAPFTLAVIIFCKNLLVAVICFLSALGTRGVLPGLIILFNGLIIGVLAVFLHQDGLAYGSFALLLLPHGIFELPAIFLACAIGMQGVGAAMWMAMGLPTAMLAVAAVTEVFVSPLLG